MQILLIRHGESEADILNVHEGRADFELTEKGRQQVQRLVQKVKADFPPDFIWASTLKRARETGEMSRRNWMPNSIRRGINGV